ncbi:hypothetical protein SSX86_015655 [Deinandra increscens subsp. villosa]|uniref:PGG domain-containing protein n=1 Tax=Deinandra increscens subsp. villosa TaxID=3103831 RepID=A0AAP0GZ94_9ASTR
MFLNYKEETETKEETTLRRRKEAEKYNLYRATLAGDFERVEAVFDRMFVRPGERITINGNTALHVAVGTSKNTKFLQNMVRRDYSSLHIPNSEGSTPLHVAAIVGNTKAAEMLVKARPNLLFAEDNEAQTAVSRALSNMHTDTYLFLWEQLQDREGASYSGCALMVNMISSKDYHSTIIWGLLRFKFVEAALIEVHAKLLLRGICQLIKLKIEYSHHHDYYKNAILEATKQNAYKVVKIIVSEFPNAIWSINEDGHNIIQCAVINRSETVYNMLYQMSEHKNIYKTIKDPLGNNLLHLAARLAPDNKLNPISGAALQIQFELQWFKEVERFVCPLNILEKNNFGETPQMAFTKEHKELLIEGEKWMKETAQSYTITAALITTIVFAAAITVPGGNDQVKGTPLFIDKTAFKIFAISDAISLFAAVSSLLMFLSILTARFSEKDFLRKLPTKLIIGLSSLFISTTAMLVAFGATLFLVFGHDNSQILIYIAVLTCLTLTSFVPSQFRLIYDLISATYGRSIFGKKSDNRFY